LAFVNAVAVSQPTVPEQSLSLVLMLAVTSGGQLSH